MQWSIIFTDNFAENKIVYKHNQHKIVYKHNQHIDVLTSVTLTPTFLTSRLMPKS